MEVRRFGYGHRRPEGPSGSRGVTGAVIHSDARGTIAELAFGRRSVVEPHTNPNPTWFVVIEGGGFVRVGDETARVFAGEAILWPAGVVHGASTELSEMRAIVVEFAGPNDEAARAILPGTPLAIEAEGIARGEGSLTGDRSTRYDPGEGEPL